jgi:hypothetical protein
MSVVIDTMAGAIKDMGRLRLSSITSMIERSPLRNVLKIGNVRSNAGVEPFPGGKWQNAESRYHLDLRHERSPEQLVDAIQLHRTAGLIRHLEELEKLFAEAGGNPDEPWLMHTLEGWWLHETICNEPGQPTICTVVIDSTVAFRKE